MSLLARRIRWWTAVAFAATLPITFNWSLENLGGYFTDWIYDGSYRDLVALAFLLTALLLVWLMTKPSDYLGLRFTFGFVSIIVCLLAAIAPRPTCDEKKFLSALGAERPAQVAYKAGCEAW